jgi:hypothetical protein
MEIPFCVIVACCSGAILLYFFYHNKGRKIERYFLKNNKRLFLVLQLSYFILILSLVFNIRFVIYHFAEQLKESMLQK